MLKNFIKISGYVIVVISFIFIIRLVFNLDLSIIKLKYNHSWIVFIFIFSLLYSMLNLLLAQNWKQIIEIIVNKKIPHNYLISIYLKSNIAKYLPSNILHMAGRHLLGKKIGISHGALVLSNIIEICFILFASSIILVISVYLNIVKVPGNFFFNKYYVIIASMLFGVFIVCFILFKFNNIIVIYQKYVNIANLYHLAKIICQYIIFFIIVGVIVFSLLKFLLYHQNINLEDAVFVICVFNLSWIAGFITPGAPGGLGVRESVFILMLSPGFGNESAFISALLLRVITILGDILAFFLAYLFSPRKEMPPKP